MNEQSSHLLERNGLKFNGFLIDQMHGKLLKWLRILGFWAESTKEILAEHKDLTDERDIRWFLYDYAQNNRLVFLSSNNEMVESIPHAIFLMSRDFIDNLILLRKMFDLNFQFDLNHSLCPLCGARLAEIDKTPQLQQEVPAFTYKTHDRFWRCSASTCDKIYWAGTHVDNFNEIIDQIRATESN